jgi:hypothetical protein
MLAVDLTVELCGLFLLEFFIHVVLLGNLLLVAEI